MNELTPRNSKADMMMSMMKNRNTSKLFRDAIKSPLGSTSREHAKKMFSIMSKLHKSNDGKGGPGMMYERQGIAPEMDPVHIPTDESKGMIIFHKIPKPNIRYGNLATKYQARPMSFDGVGGPGDSLNLLGNTSPILGGNRPLFNIAGLGTGQTIGPSTQNTINSGAGFLNIPKDTITSGILPYQPQSILTGPIAPSVSNNRYSLSPLIQKPINIGGYNAESPYSVDTSVGSLIGQQNVKSPQITSTQYGPKQVDGYVPEQTKIGNIPNNTMFRTDRNNNPTAMITALASQGGLVQGKDYVIGDPFVTSGGSTLYTAKLLGDPIEKTIKVIDRVGLYTIDGKPRWSYIDNIPEAKNWANLSYDAKADVIEKMHQIENGTGAGPSGLASLTSPQDSMSASASAAVNANMGPGMYAFNQMLDKSNPITHGKTMMEVEADNQKRLWDQYNIGGQQDEIVRMRAEGATLPENITAYITGRDQFLADTDKQIADYTNKAMTTTAMSDPANVANAKSQLNYLYTLRGKQNQSYIGYLNNAIKQHQADLDNITNHYSVALNAYENDLKNTNTITEEQYKMYAAALSDMYTTVQDAPTREQQKRLIEAQILSAAGGTAADTAKASAENGLISQGKKLEGYVWDSGHRALPGFNLSKTINDFSVLDPTIQPVNIIQAYTLGVMNYLSTPEEKDSTTGTGVTSSGKTKIAEEAIKNFAEFVAEGQDNPNAIVLGQNSANQVAQYLASTKANSIINSGKAQKLMESVKSLAPKGIFGVAKTPPSEDQFVKTVVSNTGDQMDEAIARAIYAVFKRYMSDSGNTVSSASSAVNSMLYNTSSTSTKNVLFTPDEFANNIGQIYAASLLNKAFSGQ